MSDAAQAGFQGLLSDVEAGHGREPVSFRFFSGVLNKVQRPTLERQVRVRQCTR